MMLLDSENENSDEQFDEPLVKIFVEELGVGVDKMVTSARRLVCLASAKTRF